MKISGTKNRVSLSVKGVRCGIRVSTGPWVEGVDPRQIKISPKQYAFPEEIAAVLAVHNNSDSMTDYYERDCVKLLPGHPLYEMAKAAAN